MVDLTELTYDETVVSDGAWVAPMPEWPDLKVKARINIYRREDVRSAKVRALSRKYQGDDLIPRKLLNRANLEALLETTILDVTGITDGGVPVPFDAVKGLALDDPGGRLATALFIAGEMVKVRRAEDIEDAEKN